MAKEPGSEDPARSPSALADAEAGPETPASPGKRRRRRPRAQSTASQPRAAASQAPAALVELSRKLDAQGKALEALRAQQRIGRRPLPEVVRALAARVTAAVPAARQNAQQLRKLAAAAQRLQTTGARHGRTLATLQRQAKTVDKGLAQLAKLARQLESVDDAATRALALARETQERIDAIDGAQAALREGLARIDDVAGRVARLDERADAERAQTDERFTALGRAAEEIRAAVAPVLAEWQPTRARLASLEQARAQSDARIDAFAQQLQTGLEQQRSDWGEALAQQLRALQKLEAAQAQSLEAGQSALARERALDERLRAIEAVRDTLPQRLVEAGLEGWKAANANDKSPVAGFALALRDELLKLDEVKKLSTAFEDKVQQAQANYEDLLRRRYNETSQRLDTLTSRYRLWLLLMVVLAAGFASFVR